MKRYLLMASVLPLLAGAAWLNSPDNSHEWLASAEFGALSIIEHTIQFGREGTRFDYVRDGGQNILSTFRRLSAEIHLKPRHTFVALIQPLTVETDVVLGSDLVVDDTRFVAGTPMALRYGFDFYRASWLYDFWRSPDRELAFGLSMQLRNASIAYASQDGSRFRVYRDLGPVPILKFRGRLPLGRAAWAGAEVDGFYAQGRVVTGSSNVESAFRGAILDASLRYGMRLNHALDGFVNLRYLGGGASGGQEDPENPGDGYVDNWLGTVALTLGCYLK
ncbi:hypothetical protein FJY71_01185 [candidate division WOR-3 bacterium]|nr:hypothetical protein [candidate division WOR-3 bacterium]